MKGITVNCNTGKQKLVTTAKPKPQSPPFVELKGLDLEMAAEKLAQFTQMQADIDMLKDRL